MPELLRTPATFASVRATRTSSRRDKAIFMIAEDGDTEPHESPLTQTNGTTTGIKIIHSTVTNQVDPEKENEVGGEDEAELGATLDSATHLLKPDNALGMGQGSVLIEARNHGQDLEPSILPDLQPNLEAEETPGQPSTRSVSMLEPPEHGKAKQKKRKKRTIVVLPRKKKRLSEQSAVSNDSNVSLTQNSEFQAQSEPHALLPEIPTSLEAGDTSEIYPSPGPSHSPSPASGRDISPGAMEDEGDETYIQGASPEPKTPASNRKLSKPRAKPGNPRINQVRARRKSIRPTFPILTHRLTNIPTLPTINEENDHQSQIVDDERPTLDLPAERPQPNVVDVLAQICRETIANLLKNMSQNVQRSERTPVKIKQAALEAFGEDLDEELFQMSAALENRIDLEARVRKSKREKSSLQAEYIEIRKQREQIALKCDSVRRRHWECEQDAREKWNISEAARRVELDVDRAEEGPNEGIEFLLRSVTNNVSNLSDAGGILDNAKALNMQLEAMALLLERQS
ncbi:uncharacterized protein A1O9_12573 [Exophiala aquamarina CBS 119918]|uniref:Inner kinetochore subunit AME1 domain-containing protein n=1 Tax=Exophiala aquamarina CBS 119918 TaxID=1182545 RepID=A0A072NU83_9EURO|nr:uncharacterized protein A1O9_12573 [Exophiala aquamarina CBS 119918]KEF51424.1 hypothetical protein A1O9_12573 [Exophiala aquamarina CBS 119918]